MRTEIARYLRHRLTREWRSFDELMGTAKNDGFRNECRQGLQTVGMVQRCLEGEIWRLKSPEAVWVLSWGDNIFDREDATGYACRVHGPIDNSDLDEFEAGSTRCRVREVGCFTYSGSLSKRRESV